MEILQEQLRDARNEVIESKLLFEELKEDISKKIDFYNKVAYESGKNVKENIAFA